MTILVKTIDNFSKILDPIFEQISEPLYKVFSPLYEWNKSTVAPLFGVPPDASIYLIILFVSLIISLFYRIKRFFLYLFLSPAKAGVIFHLFHLFFGIVIVGITFKRNIIHPVLIAIICYVMMKVLNRKSNVYCSFIFSFFYLAICHIYRLFSSYLEYKADFTATQMLITFKIVSLAFNIYDGERKKKNGEEWAKKNLSRDSNSNSVNVKPNFLQYMSFLFHYGTIITGPVYEYKDFINFVEKKGEDNQNVPLDVLAVLKKVFLSIIFLSVYVVLGAKGISAESVIDISGKNKIFVFFVLTNIVMFYTRCRYYFVWYFAEATCILSGFGYGGKDKYGSNIWKIQNSNALDFETATSVRTLLIKWNISVSNWLRRYAYERVNANSRILKQLYPMVVSAFWHGFYPGYYIMWTALVFLTQVYVEIYKRISPRILDMKKPTPLILRFILPFIAITLVCHVCIPFMILSLENCINFFNSFKWIIHISILIAFVIVQMIPRPPRQTKKETKKDI